MIIVIVSDACKYELLYIWFIVLIFSSFNMFQIKKWPNSLKKSICDNWDYIRHWDQNLLGAGSGRGVRQRGHREVVIGAACRYCWVSCHSLNLPIFTIFTLLTTLYTNIYEKQKWRIHHKTCGLKKVWIDHLHDEMITTTSDYCGMPVNPMWHASKVFP